MKVLITGGTGFIGSNLCKKLLELDHYVICLDNLLTGSYKNIEKFLNSSVILALTFNDKIKKIKIQSNFFTLIFFFPNIIK